MSEETGAVPGTVPASTDAAAIAAETPAEQATSTGEVKPDADKAQEQEKKPDPLKAELSYLRRELRRQERAREQLMARMLESQGRPVQEATAPKQPRMQDFATVEEYLDARDAYNDARRGGERNKADQPARTPNADATEYHQAIASAREDLSSAGSEKYSDFEDVVFDDGVKISPAMRDAIFALDDVGIQADVAYHLGKNPKEALRISRLPPLRQIAEIGKLELKLQTTPPKRPSAAPAPVSPVGGGKTSADEIQGTESFESFLKKRNKQLGRK